MSATTGVIAGSDAAASDAAAWAQIRADTSLQFAPLPPAPQPQTPEWLLAFGRWLEALLRPLGEILKLDWRWLMWLLIALAAAGALWLLWAVAIEPLLARRRAVHASTEDWSPDRASALALLEDADRLAAAGRFAEAAHLLLQRSVGQIAQARPDWLSPASTAREIGASALLPERARTAFGSIAGIVEAGRYALRETGAGDWNTARAAYAEFALADLRRAAS